MNFLRRLEMAKKIVDKSQYAVHKETIKNLFKKTGNRKADLLLRLIAIDSCYSTNMGKRYFGFEDLAVLLMKIHHDLTPDIDVTRFTHDKWALLTSKQGITKKGRTGGHALSLLSKYIYFQTRFSFPIFDSLVLKELQHEGIKGILTGQSPKPKYFEVLISIKEHYSISVDELDLYFWVCGKIRQGNLSLLLPDKTIYIKEFLGELQLSAYDYSQKSDKFNEIISEKLHDQSVVFEDESMQMIQSLAISLHTQQKVLGI